MSCCWLTNILVTGPWMLWGWCSLQPKSPTFTVTVGQVGPVRAMPRHLTKLTGSSSHLGLRPWPAGQLLSCRNWIWPRVKTFGDGSSTVQRWITRKFFGLPGNSLKIACLDAYFKHYSICYRWTHAVRGWRHDCSRWYAWHPIWIQWQAETGKIPSAKNSQESFGVETKRRTDTFSVQLLTDLRRFAQKLHRICTDSRQINTWIRSMETGFLDNQDNPNIFQLDQAGQSPPLRRRVTNRCQGGFEGHMGDGLMCVFPGWIWLVV